MATGNLGNSPPRDCREVYERGCTREGVYTIDPKCPGQKPFQVYCSNQYTVFQRRRNGAVEFNKTWEEYKNGFGDVNWEVWLGLQKIHCLTSARSTVSLRIELTDCDGVSKHAHYNYFHVDGEGTDYRLSIGGYSGTAGDMLTPHNKWSFTTIDRDLTWCTQMYATSGWWHHDRGCFAGALNGPYICGKVKKGWSGVVWWSFRGAEQSMKFAEMKIR